MAHKARFLYLNDAGDLQEGMSSGVFITNITPQDTEKVVDITWADNVIGDNVVESIVTDTELITVTVEWDGTAYHFNGDIRINGILVTNVSRIGVTRRFEGTLDLDLAGSDEIVAIHSDGAFSKVDVSLQGQGPTITDVKFFGDYPGTQTEVKNNDTFQIQIHFDPAGSIPSHVEISNFGACKSAVIDLSTTELVWGTVHYATVTATIDATGTTPQSLPVRVRSRNDFGTYGNYLDSDHDGVDDGYHRVTCNDRTPVISFGTVTYLSGYSALKDAESATVNFNYSYTDSVVFSSPNSQLEITDPTVLESPKTVQRITGDYNVSVNNLRAVAHREANDTFSTANRVVNIAHVAPTITVFEPTDRLVSGGNDGTTMQNHTISITSSQMLSQIPLLSAPVGTLSAFSGLVPGTVFTATIGVHDNDPRGIYQWQSLEAVNLAGIVQNIISGNDEYEIGGFVQRDIYFSPQSNEEVLGVYISDPSKTVCLDKDLQAMEYRGADLTDYRRGYSFTDPSNVFNPQGNILFWCDRQDVENNTTGLAFIRIRETA